MATKLKNLSSHTGNVIPSAEKMRFGIVVSEWNTEITNNLLNGARASLLLHGAKEKNIYIHHVPGSFELPMGAQLIAEYKKVDAIICLGCVIQGETRHFEFICNAVAQGITRVNLDYNLPVIFGLLTTNDQQQAKDRSGGKHGNKGDEAAFTAIKMIDLKNKLKSKSTIE
jgi:6,7-dimethyl-8-ribityllumazine synthase